MRVNCSLGVASICATVRSQQNASRLSIVVRPVCLLIAHRLIVQLLASASLVQGQRLVSVGIICTRPLLQISARLRWFALLFLLLVLMAFCGCVVR
jgi:hypothetical protein